MADQLDDRRLDGLFRTGVDEVAYRKQHHYLTLITNHDSGTIIWAKEGKTAATLDGLAGRCGGPTKASRRCEPSLIPT